MHLNETFYIWTIKISKFGIEKWINLTLPHTKKDNKKGIYQKKILKATWFYVFVKYFEKYNSLWIVHKISRQALTFAEIFRELRKNRIQFKSMKNLKNQRIVKHKSHV